MFLGDPARRSWLRAGRSLRIRAHRPGRADRRDRRAGAAHRLDVQGRLARAPERVRVHERPVARGQSAASRREAAAVRRRGAARDSRASLLLARDSSLVATADDERRAPAAGRDASRPRPTRSGRVDVRVRVSDPQSFVGWFVELPWLAAPHHPFRLAVRIVDLDDEQAGTPPRGLPGGAGARPARRPPLRSGNRAEPPGRRLHAASRLDPMRRRVLVSSLSPVLGHDAAPRRALRRPGPRAWDAAGNVATCERGRHDRERRLGSDVGNEAEPAHRAGKLQAPIALGGVAPRARDLLERSLAGRARAGLGRSGRTGSPDP